MKATGRAADERLPRWLFGWLAMLCVMAIPASAPGAQTASMPRSATATKPPETAPLVDIHGVVTLDGPWRFQIGDDPRYCDPAFDDSSWTEVMLGQTLSEQGLDAYSGYAWYRLRLSPRQMVEFGKPENNAAISLLLTSYSIGQLQVFVDGHEIAHTRGIGDHPAMYQSPPLVAHLPASPDGGHLIAVRTWAGPNIPVKHGLLEKVELGSESDIADRLALAIGRQWDENVIAPAVVTFLFLFVAALGATLYLSQRHHSEYLWMALMCLSVGLTGIIETAYGQSMISLPVYSLLEIWLGRIFMVVTLEFILRFTASPERRIVRGVQIAALVVPVLSLLSLEGIYGPLSIGLQILFCALVCVLLFRAWRKGLQEAGVMLVPFFLAATASSADTVLDYAAGKHWLPDSFASHRFHIGPVEFATGTITYTIFLASLIAVILYRFVRVSQVEQQSAAEIAAARSVQALLIPTQLPSNKNFMLDSAYLPVHGVGGDFFQVLPLKDDSILIVVGDVSGKGLQAAMNASTLVGALRNELSYNPATVLTHLNRVLLGAAPVPSKLPGLDAAPGFATCLCARIYPDGRMTIANAGHLSPYRDGREMEIAPGLPLGIIAEISYESTDYQLEKGQRVIFLSDGVVEATNSDGELFGFERTQQVSNEPARYIAQTAQHFGQNDDITVVSVYIASRTAQRANEAAAVTG
jgi:Stage II sporulation protein E (SpoIIE)/7TM diverse intracellular signalling